MHDIIYLNFNNKAAEVVEHIANKALTLSDWLERMCYINYWSLDQPYIDKWSVCFFGRIMIMAQQQGIINRDLMDEKVIPTWTSYKLT